MFGDKLMARFGVGVGMVTMISGSAMVCMWNGWPSILGGVMFLLTASTTWILLPTALRQS